MSEFQKRLSYFNVAEGLQRVGGDESFYIELLSDFVSEFRDSADRYEQILRNGDTEEARRLVHSVKGVSGNLGAKRLHEAAAALEGAVKADDMNSAALLLGPFRAELQAAVNELEQSGLLEKESSEAEEVPVNRLIDLVSEFSGYASSRKAKPAKDLAREFEKYLWPAQAEPLINEIKMLIKKYKLIEAAEAADGLLNVLKNLA